jgi:hypothetical protein
MLARRRTRTLGATAVLVAAALVLGVVAAPGQPGHVKAVKKITATGAGTVKLGKTFKQLRAAGLVGRLRHGCELGGPNTRSARLRAPLKGGVDFTPTSPRKAMTISVTGGGEAHGVGIGDTLADIKAAYPKAKVDHGTEKTFGITRVKIPRNGGGRLAFSVSVDSGRIDLIGVPDLAFCE